MILLNHIFVILIIMQRLKHILLGMIFTCEFQYVLQSLRA